MTDYKNSRIWEITFGAQGDYQNERDYLKMEFEKVHKNAQILASEINRFMPDFTVHDISHSDSLWKMTDIFLPNEYNLNPAEVFVLGVSFLLHDLGMGLTVYPEGMNGLQKEPLWRDTVASLCKEQNCEFDFENITTVDEDIRRKATENTLRVLHTEKVRTLGTTSWKLENGEAMYLIDNFELRSAYGEIVGIIAQSHGWDDQQIQQELSIVQGALSHFPTNWTVDSLKLACIIRIADALHIDDSRAPKLLRAIRSPKGTSDLHWVFQEKLSQPKIINNYIEYTSKSAFSIDERDAWWLCYDTLTWIDRELRNVDSILTQNNKQTFGIVGIYCIDNLYELTKRIKAEGWEPIDTRIQVRNVAKLVHMLGGEFLYGSNMLVPLREMIQNATDAIRARRYLDNESHDYGSVTVTIGKIGENEYIEVEDNGIGMSPNTMTNVLLDFGQSFWSSENMHREFPGLEQTSFRSTGHFGIGFFSVFMWGKHIEIISNRFDKARDDTMVLEFSAGIETRPVLRRAKQNERIKNGGTKVRVYLSELNSEEIFHSDGRNKKCIEEWIVHLCPNLDCNLNLVVNGKNKRLITANDWISLDSKSFLMRFLDWEDVSKLQNSYPEIFQTICKNTQLIYDNEHIVGRACLFSPHYSRSIYFYGLHGCTTVGGFYATKLNSIIGILVGKVTRASRDSALPTISQGALDKWVEQQAELLIASNISERILLSISESACALSQKNTQLKIAEWNNHYISYNEIVDLVRNSSYNEFLLVQNATVNLQRNYAQDKLVLNDNVIVCEMGVATILNSRDIYLTDWPYLCEDINDSFYASSIKGRIINAIAEGWNVNSEALENRYRNDDISEDKAIVVSIGTINGQQVMERAYKIIRPQ